VTTPIPTRTVAGLEIPLDLVPRIIAAIYARYPDATKGITDPELAVRVALAAWVEELLSDYEAGQARAPLPMAVAQTIADYDARSTQARTKAKQDAKRIRVAESAPPVPVTPPA
jgi:hypothetical protein